MKTLLRKWRTAIPPIKYLAFICLLIFTPFDSSSQINELVNQVNSAEQGVAQIGNSIFNIIKIAAGVMIAISGITFMIIREQNQDMARKVGNIFVGLVIFYGLLEIGENLAR